MCLDGGVFPVNRTMFFKVKHRTVVKEYRQVHIVNNFAVIMFSEVLNMSVMIES